MWACYTEILIKIVKYTKNSSLDGNKFLVSFQDRLNVTGQLHIAEFMSVTNTVSFVLLRGKLSATGSYRQINGNCNSQ
jgi:hypothetical protein